MSRPVRIALGLVLLMLPAIAIIQTCREITLSTLGGGRYTEKYPLERTIDFGGRQITVDDDQPVLEVDVSEREDAVPGNLRISLDGDLLGTASYARVRPGRHDLGRYHLWLDAWEFRDSRTGTSSLWIARRLKAVDGAFASYEVTVVSQDGSVHTRHLRPWQLGLDSRTYRATQFLTRGSWEALPLTLGDVAGFFPMALLIFPIGTSVAGILILRSVPSRSAV